LTSDRSPSATLFTTRFTEQAGQVSEAHDLAEAAAVLTNILGRASVRTVALATMPSAIREQITQSLESRGITLVDAKGTEAPRALSTVDAGVTVASLAVADTGAVVELTHDDADRLVSALPKIHACLLPRERIVAKLEDAAGFLRAAVQAAGSSTVSFIAGPSRTADVEMRLVLGVHGPHQVHVILFGGE